MKKIRFVNPIKECISIQGKTYTVSLIITIAALFALCGITILMKMYIAAVVAGVAAIASTIFFGWWFATKYSNLEEEEY